MENKRGSNHDNGQVQVQVELHAQKSLDEWKNILDENFEQVLKKYRAGNEKQGPISSSKPNVKKFKEDLKRSLPVEAGKILINFLPEQLKSSQYFYYANLKDELEVAEELLQTIFPDQADFALETHYFELSRMIQLKNEENKKRHEKIKHDLDAAFDLMRKSEFQRLKELAEEFAPEPIKWVSKTTQEVQHQFFGPLLQSIDETEIETTTTTKIVLVDLDLDLQFQKECHESTLKKTASVFKATRTACYLLRLYARVMEEQLDKIVFFPSEADFTLFSDSAFVDCYNQIYVLTPAKHFQTVWSQLDEDLKSAVLEYKKAFWLKNLQICQQQDESVEQVVDFAVEKYNSFIHQAKIQCFGSDYEHRIFRAAQLSLFHSNAVSVIKECFAENPRFKFSLTRDIAWEKINEAMAQLWREDLEKNERKIQRMTVQQKYVMTIAENGYQKLMKHFFSSFSSSLSRDGSEFEESWTELENFHLMAVKWAQDFYQEKLEKVDKFYHYQGDGNDEQELDKDRAKDKETLYLKCAEMKEQLLKKHKENVVKEMKEKKEQQEKQQKTPFQTIDFKIFNIPVKNEPFSGNNTPWSLEGAVKGASQKTGASLADATDKNNINRAGTRIEEIRLRGDGSILDLELAVTQLKSQLETVQNESSFLRYDNNVKSKVEDWSRRVKECCQTIKNLRTNY